MNSESRFMLDTDTVSFVLRDVGETAANLLKHPPSTICMSAMTLSELKFGADKRKSKRLHNLIDAFCKTVHVASFGAAEAAAFGRVRTMLESKGNPIGILDTLIAAHALALDLTLVTNNTKHFGKVRGLKTANWSGEAGDVNRQESHTL